MLGHHGEGLSGDVGSLEHGSRVHTADETAHIVVGGVAQDVVGRTHLHHLPVFHDGDAVANAHGLVQVVRDEDDGAPPHLLQAQQLRLHFGADDGVQRRKRFIHQQDRGVRRQRPGQPHALLHPAGEFVRVAVAPPGQTHLLQRLGCLRLALGAIHARQLQAQCRVVQHRHVGHQGKRLEHHADVFATQRSQLRVGQLRDVHPVHQDATGAGLNQQIQQPHQGGFARARQTHDHKNLARLDRQVGVKHPDGLPRAGQDFLLAQALANQRQGLLWIVSKDLEHVVNHNLFCHGLPPPG